MVICGDLVQTPDEKSFADFELGSRILAVVLELVQARKLEREACEVVGPDEADAPIPWQDSHENAVDLLVRLNNRPPVGDTYVPFGSLVPAVSVSLEFGLGLLVAFRVLVVVGAHVGVAVKTERDGVGCRVVSPF